MSVEALKTRKGLRGFRSKHTEHPKQRQAGRESSSKKVVELAFWGTVIWGIVRMAAHFLNLTPYGLGAFARPILAGIEENTIAANGLGFAILFVETLVATSLFSMLFRNVRIWWSGLIFGAVMLGVAGYFFRIGNWEVSTLSTEAAWFVSFGLFIGMTLTLEASDDQE